MTAFELGNGTWGVPFPDRARSLPRERKHRDFNLLFARALFCPYLTISALRVCMPCGYKLSPAAQGNLACSIISEIPYYSLPCVRGEKALSCLSGFPQKSRSEFCGKRSGRHIRSCGKRSAPQTKTPCRDEVGSLPFASLEMAHGACHFLTEAAFPLRRRDGGTLSNIYVGDATEGVVAGVNANFLASLSEGGAERL